MNNEEKMIIIGLLIDEYNRTKRVELIDLMDKVKRSNFIFEHLEIANCNITANSPLDCNNFVYEKLHLKNTYLKFTKNVISTMSLDEFKRLKE